MSNEFSRILVTGSLGQIGTELTAALRVKYGNENVIATDIREAGDAPIATDGPFRTLDVMNKDALDELVREFKIDCIVHLAAILSATGENDPIRAWNINMGGLINVLEVARERQLRQVMCPSSIAVFGPGTPLEHTPTDTVLKPTTIYGVTKVAGERLADYYVQKFGLDVRGLRYPGIISAETEPGGGTTDYAVAIFYEAIKNGNYTCFVREDCRLPMMYMPDCIKATMDLMAAPCPKLKHHADFNVGSMSFTAGQLAQEIKKHIPDFEVCYNPDYRQAIADSWPHSVDDTSAREEWGWEPAYNLAAMTKDMIEKLQKRHNEGDL